MRVWIVNGPNLNLLGEREPEIYGRETLADIEARCRTKAESLGVTLTFRQSNHEGELIDWVQQAGKEADGLILNPGGFTHTSVSLLDALLSLKIPVIEVHLSNLYKREEFRQKSLTARAAKGIIAGLGAEGYLLALTALNLSQGRVGK